MKFAYLVLLLFSLPAIAMSATINVPGDYATIQGAIDAAGSGDFINVASGAYEEQLTIDGLSITIQGAGKGLTHIQSPDTLSLSFTHTTDKYCIVTCINGGALTLNDVTVDGLGKGNANNQFIGVGYRNSGGALNDCDIVNVRDTPFSGAQHGVGLYALCNDGNMKTLTITNCDLSGCQKNSMALNGPDLTANVISSSTTGVGQTSVTAQNGIQFTNASGVINGCTVTGHCYTGSGWTASGILLFNGTVDILNATSVVDNQTGVYFNEGASGSFKNSTLTAGVNAQGQGGYYYGVGCYDQGDTDGGFSFQGPLASPYGEGLRGNSRAASVVVVESCIIDADQSGEAIGVGIWNNVDVSVDTCNITDWAYGVDFWGDGAYTPVGDVSGCTITGNTINGVLNSTPAPQPTIIAEDNWWGHASGPYHATLNPTGTGDSVTDNVDFDPWLGSEPLAVTFVRFKAKGHHNRADLFWETGSELNNAGFHIWRRRGGSKQNGEFVRITSKLIPAKGGPSQGAVYRFTDRDVIKGFTYTYRIEDIDYSGLSWFTRDVMVQCRGR